jgi:agmatine deiminase
MPHSVSIPSVTPATLGYRMPAEWEPHEATWLAWPHNLNTWPGKFDLVPDIYVEIVRALHTHELVYIYVEDTEMVTETRKLLKREGLNLSAVKFYEILTDDTWARDHGPIFVSRLHGNKPELAVTDWIFNSWGEKYGPWNLDDAVPQKIAEMLRLPLFEPGIVLEGGSIDVNGQGTLLTTEACLLNPNRNPTLTREDIETYLRAYLGVTNILWLGEGIVGDDTDGHVDDLTRFVNPTTVVCALEDDPVDANYALLRDNFDRLQKMTDQNGNPLRVVPLCMPSPVVYDGSRLPASYANFYIANGVVLMPTYDCPNDKRAMATLQELFPTRQVVGIHCTDLVWGLGAIHCITQQQPALY